ncbi:Kelch repeat-containing protein [Engelhardtia mirabilis]|uniref:N-acetylneuraminate epimerase n=1 Tax=Engelhardtia mirabilis TaxID=2528011 RepID=A0A518BNF8_9BACT|nr:N-acetylneuraminate epimerase [Planctomycetes bacterium Pla133]QDV02811.1 N-acetylneuraminate epimerase [Planctomycetes bacterium Pla86]
MRVSLPAAGLLAGLSLAHLAPLANAEDAVLTVDGGVLGTPVTYATAGDLGQFYVLFVSFNQGPTPLALIDPTNPGLLSVGIDLLDFLTVSAIPVPAVYPLPASAALDGLALNAQFITILGPTSFVDEVSNPCRIVLALPGSTHFTLGENVTARQGHTLSPLPGGGAIAIGGDEPDGLGNLTTLNSFEIYDDCGQSFAQTTGTLTQARSTHTATVLTDDRILLLGGYGADGVVDNTGEIYDPVTGTSAATANMSMPRTQHTATRLADGRVLVIGGSSLFDLSDPINSLASSTATTEIYDPVADSWSPGPNLPEPLIGHTATLLGNGKVLVAGGVATAVVFGIPFPDVSNAARLYNPVTNTFESVAAVPGNRAYHGAVGLPDGSALVYGGADGSFVTLTATTLTSAARFNPSTNTWAATGSLNQARAYPNTVLGASGGTLVMGGLQTVDLVSGSGQPSLNYERLDPVSLTWTTAGAGLVEREVGRSVAIDGGIRVLTVGRGEIAGGPAVVKSAEVYVP